jgi:hypothetical protein
VLGKNGPELRPDVTREALVSTVESTTGTLNTLAAFAKPTTLLMIVCRSKLATPKSICGWWSMNVTTQLSGVR